MRPDETWPDSGYLKDMISRHMAKPGHIPLAQPCADFIMSACRAAFAAGPNNRQNILSDMANAMNCNVEELKFLFIDSQLNLSDPLRHEIEVPDFRQELLAVAE